jgi:hypothetical protein
VGFVVWGVPQAGPTYSYYVEHPRGLVWWAVSAAAAPLTPETTRTFLNPGLSNKLVNGIGCLPPFACLVYRTHKRSSSQPMLGGQRGMFPQAPLLREGVMRHTPRGGGG